MMKSLRYLISFIIAISINSFVLSQDDFGDEAESDGPGAVINIVGSVTDSNTGRPLAGANLVIDGTDLGTATDAEGTFSFEGIETGISITVSMIGYEDATVYADTENLEISLMAKVIEMSALEVLASRAGEKTPVAYTNVDKEDLQLRLGSRDIPLALNMIPSVYATGQGGGAGDARINVRGFNQRNVAVMINGVPVNDVENGWVYWSNWDGLADATSSIQMQKGLSAQNLATPSIGGSMNVITDPSSQDRRGLFKQEIGAYGFLKTTLSAHSGLMLDDKLAMSATVVRKTGTGYMQGTWTDAWAYYFDATYNLNDQHRLQFYALGAPQQHGQNRYKQNIAVYDTEFAKSLDDYDQTALTENDGEFMEAGRDFNQNTAEISEASQAILDAAGGQHWEMYATRDGVKRHEADRLNERMNFFHKPQVALNHYWTMNDNMNLTSSLYWSGGKGGGSGHYGDVARIDADGVSDLRAEKHKFYYGPSPWVYDYDGTIAANASDASNVVIFQGDTVSRGDQESIGILRNSNNRQSTIGALTKLNYQVNDNIKAQVGLDWRTAEIYHVKTIRDLLGGSYFVNTDSDFDAPGQQKGLGDPIDYNFTNTVDWLGLFGQAEYSAGDITAYGMAGLTTVKYTMQDHFKAAANYDYSYVEEKDGSGLDWVEAPGDENGGNAGELYIEADPISTSQIKGGLMYSLGDRLSVFNVIPVFGKLYDNVDAWINFGLIDKAPTFDQVIQDWDAKMSTDPKNENFTAFELGFNSSSNDGTMAAKFNIYSTQWKDRIQTKSVQDQGDSTDDIIVYLTGIDQAHSGIEFELAWQLNEMFRLDMGVGLGNWTYTSDASGTYRDGDSDVEFAYALEDLGVGDMPQRNLVLGLTVSPVEGATVQAIYKYYDKHIADWNISSREYDPASGGDFGGSDELWQAPSYGILDIHAYYDLPFELGNAKPQVFLHVFNALDEVYIQDAVHISSYNSWDKRAPFADDAEVFFGLPTSFNLGLSVNF